MKLNISSPSTVLTLTLEEVKDHLRVDCDDEDALLSGYIRAETDSVEQVLNRALVTQTVDLYLDAFPADGTIDLPRSPVQSVTGVNYTTQGSTGVYGSTVGAAQYTADIFSTPARVVLKSSGTWPDADLETDNPIRVRYTAGYGDMGSDVPEPIRTALLLRIGDRYWQREALSGMTRYPLRADDRLLAPYKVW
jgi:uncharacterized phiE125 gp8 family phage protein